MKSRPTVAGDGVRLLLEAASASWSRLSAWLKESLLLCRRLPSIITLVRGVFVLRTSRRDSLNIRDGSITEVGTIFAKEGEGYLLLISLISCCWLSR